MTVRFVLGVDGQVQEDEVVELKGIGSKEKNKEMLIDKEYNKWLDTKIDITMDSKEIDTYWEYVM